MDAYWCLAHGALRVETTETLHADHLHESPRLARAPGRVGGLQGLDRRPPASV
jgi:hypothetical protein